MMKLKLYVGIFLLVLFGFVSGVTTTLLVTRYQISHSLLGEHTLLRRIIARRIASKLDMNDQEQESLDQFFTQSILTLRLQHLPFEATVGSTLLNGLDRFIENKPLEQQELHRQMFIKRYAYARQPVRSSLFYSLSLSIDQIQELESILAQHDGFEFQVYSDVPHMMFGLVRYKENEIQGILNKEQKMLFSEWINNQSLSFYTP